MELLTFNTTEQVLLAAMSILFLMQVLYYFCLYNRINMQHRAVDRNKVEYSSDFPPLSVIICAHDEVDNLQKNLTTVLEQDYPRFEVIVINDGDTVESDEYLMLMEKKYPHLYHSFVPESSRYISHRKLAATLGVKASKYDWLVFTHAGCCPQSNRWLKMLARNFTSQTQIVLGYSCYVRVKGWLHKQVAFDNLFTAMRYLGFALGRSPYMGIGSNLAYRKELFYKHKGFSAHLILRRGDDDLFVNYAATGQNTRVETSAASVVCMAAVARAKDWREEKIAYASTSRLYHGLQRYLNGGETATRLLFYLAWIATLAVGIMQGQWVMAGIAVFVFLLRFLLQAAVVNRTARNFEESRRYYFSLPVFDLLQPLQSLCWKSHCLFRKKSEFLRK